MFTPFSKIFTAPGFSLEYPDPPPVIVMEEAVPFPSTDPTLTLNPVPTAPTPV